MAPAEGGCVIIETPAEGLVVAEAAGILGEGTAECFRSLKLGELPITLGRIISKDVIEGLEDIAYNNTQLESITQAQAVAYLAVLGLSRQTHIAEAS